MGGLVFDSSNKSDYSNITFTLTSINDDSFEPISPKIKYGWYKCDNNGENCAETSTTKVRNLKLSDDGKKLSAVISDIPQNGVYQLKADPVNVITSNGNQPLITPFESEIFKMDSIKPDKPTFDPATSYGWKGQIFTSTNNYVFNVNT